MGKGSKIYRFERFEEHIYPELIKAIERDLIEMDKEHRVVRFYKREKGLKGRCFMQFFPIGNLVQIPANKWVREDGIGYLAKEIFGHERPELSDLLYENVLPKVKPSSVKQKKQKINLKAETLTFVGYDYAEINLKNKKTLAVIKMAKSLTESGIPFIEEFPVVIKQASISNGQPKLYLLDFYIPPPFNFIIEVDGGYHSTAEQIALDKTRDASVSAKGLGQTIRFTNELILWEGFNIMRTLKQNHVFRHAALRARTQRALQDF